MFRTAVVCSFLFFPVLCPGQSLAPDVVGAIKESAVYIRVLHRFPLTGQEVPTSGSGFFIHKSGLVATNYHVIEPVITAYEMTFPAPCTAVSVIRHSGSRSYRTLTAVVLAIDKENDLAILGVSDTAGITPLEFADSASLAETMRLWVFGYPFGEAFTVIQCGPEITAGEGSLTALRHDDRGALTSLQIDASINPGNSGGPVVNEKGRVVGVVRMAAGDNRLNMAVPPHLLSALLKKCPVMGDSAAISFSSDPSGAALFIDGAACGTAPARLRLRSGVHLLCAVKQGYESWIDERTLDSSRSVEAKLVPAGNQVVPAAITGAPKDRSVSIPPPDSACARFVLRNAALPKTLLLREDFDDRSRFDRWRQYTGGTDKRTWFLENGCLHQFESSEVLHAIVLGDSSCGNYCIRAKMKIADAHDDSRAGLIFRETADGFYVFRIHKESCKAQLAYHRKRPFGWFICAEEKLNGEIGDAWHAIAVNAAGSAITCFFNGRPVIYTVAAYSDRGKIGFYSVESKPSFDSLAVMERPAGPAVRGTAEANSLVSFWFADYFNLKSTWWRQQEDDGGRLAPWFLTEGGFAQLSDDGRQRSSECTRYRIADFAMNLAVSLGKGGDTASFKLFFRKNGNAYSALEFSKRDNRVRIISVNGREKKVLKEGPLPAGVFNATLHLEIMVNKKQVSCGTREGGLIVCRGRNIAEESGTFGFATIGVPLILHQMVVSSVKK